MLTTSARIEPATSRCTWCQVTACPLDSRPQREVQVGPDKAEVAASFCYLGDMLSATFNHNMCENCLEEVQRAAPSISSHHLSFKTRGRMYSSCVWSTMLHVSETWPLKKPNLQRLQYLQCQATRHCQHLVQWATWTALHWGSGPHPEGEDSTSTDRWNTPRVQSRQPVTCRLMESSLGGPSWHGSSWQKGIAESGSSWLLTLMIDTPGDMVVRSSMRAASQIPGRGPTDVDVAPVPAH